GEVEPVLAVGDVDPVRQEEVSPDQHVVAEEVAFADAQACVAHFLVANLEAGEGRDPRAPAVRPNAAPYPAVHDARGLRRRSEEHTSELQSPYDLVCRLLLEKKNKKYNNTTHCDLNLARGTD